MTTRTVPMALATIAASLALVGCSSTPAPEAAAPATEATADPNEDVCIYLLGGAFDDTIEFGGTYLGDRDNADMDDLPGIIEDWTVASQSATGALSTHVDALLVELEAIQSRVDGPDPLAPVDYQAISDSLDGALTECETIIAAEDG